MKTLELNQSHTSCFFRRQEINCEFFHAVRRIFRGDGYLFFLKSDIPIKYAPFRLSFCRREKLLPYREKTRSFVSFKIEPQHRKSRFPEYLRAFKNRPRRGISLALEHLRKQTRRFLENRSRIVFKGNYEKTETIEKTQFVAQCFGLFANNGKNSVEKISRQRKRFGIASERSSALNLLRENKYENYTRYENQGSFSV